MPIGDQVSSRAGSAAPVPAAAPPGPTALRIALGGQLRQMREARGITRETAADAIRGSSAKISRMERGRVGLKERDVNDLLTLYGVVDREEILSLVRQAVTPGWWQEYGDVTPGWFEMFLGLEQSAAMIRTYEAHFVPGLLQTPEYARHVISLGPWDAAEVDRRTELRLRRGRVLAGSRSPALWAVLEEAALRRPAVPQAILRAQLEHLVRMAALPHVTLQLVPQSFGGHPITGLPFTILRFAEPDLPDIVYLEQLTGALYLDRRNDVSYYTASLDSLCGQILTRDQTRAALDDMVREL